MNKAEIEEWIASHDGEIPTFKDIHEADAARGEKNVIYGHQMLEINSFMERLEADQLTASDVTFDCAVEIAKDILNGKIATTKPKVKLASRLQILATNRDPELDQRFVDEVRSD